MSKEQVLFFPDKYYHIFNHGNAEDNIFRWDDNYYYFLKKYAQYLNPITQTYAYCLMPNHFHFLVKIKSEEELVKYFQSKQSANGGNLPGLQDLTGLISKQYSNFFNAYTRAFNIQQNRTGRLFLDTVKRKAVNNREYFSQLVHYIHYNPIHHGFVKSIHDWPHSSYHSLISEKKTNLDRKTVMEWFGSSKDFLLQHRKRVEHKAILEMDF